MLHPDESTLIGRWIDDGRVVVADETCRRIDMLVASHLIELATSADGWSALYQDPADGRLWERTYPQSDLHGGGPPSLQCISPTQARAAYGQWPKNGHS